MIELFLEGFLNILNFQTILFIAVGVIIGIIFGGIPGLTSTMGLVLFLPVTFGMETIDGMALLVGLFIGGVSGGLIAAILINIPGTPASIATTFDGYPMAVNGQAGRALGIGVISSFIGGLLSIITLMAIAPPLATFAVKFSPFDYFGVSVFALTLIASLSQGSTIKGLLSGLIGMGFALVGTAPIDAYPRFTFGFSELNAGFDLLIFLIGVFAISEVLKTAERDGKPSKKINYKNKIRGFNYPLSDLIKQKWNLLRSSVIGIVIGIMPGIGGSTSNLISYYTAKKQSKYPEKFGTGIDDGIVASEAANNATVGGALIPLFVLGIPGDAGTAVLLGALTINGLTPGPQLFSVNGDIVYGILIAVFIANLFMFIFYYFGISWFIKMMSIPKHYLLPIVLILCTVGALASNGRFFDIWALFFFGLLGYVLIKFDFPLPNLIIGFILGPIMEENLRRGLMQSKGDFMPFLTEPVAAIFILLAFLSIFVPILQHFGKKES